MSSFYSHYYIGPVRVDFISHGVGSMRTSIYQQSSGQRVYEHHLDPGLQRRIEDAREMAIESAYREERRIQREEEAHRSWLERDLNGAYTDPWRDYD